MVAVNGLAVMLAGILLAALAGKEKSDARHELQNISQSFQRWLLICVTAGFLMTTFFTWALQTELAENEAHDLVKLNLEDVRQDILDVSNENLLKLATNISPSHQFHLKCRCRVTRVSCEEIRCSRDKHH